MSLCSQTQPSFILVCEIQSNELIEQIVLFFSSADQVVQTFAQSADVIRVKQATIASPPAINGTTSWKYETLIEIARARHKISGEIYLVFCIETGERYLELRDGTTVDDLIDVVPVVRFGRFISFWDESTAPRRI